MLYVTYIWCLRDWEAGYLQGAPVTLAPKLILSPSTPRIRSSPTSQLSLLKLRDCRDRPHTHTAFSQPKNSHPFWWCQLWQQEYCMLWTGKFENNLLFVICLLKYQTSNHITARLADVVDLVWSLWINWPWKDPPHTFWRLPIKGLKPLVLKWSIMEWWWLRWQTMVMMVVKMI